MRYSLFILFAFAITKVSAHEPGVTDTHLNAGPAHLNIVYTLPDKDSQAAPHSLGDYRNAYTVYNDSVLCALASYRQERLEKIASTQYFYRYDCSEQLGDVRVRYNLFNNDLSHQNHSRFSIGQRYQPFIFSSEYSEHTVTVGKFVKKWNLSEQDFFQNQGEEDGFSEGLMATADYFGVGFFHILEGYDHILFLLGLLLLPLGIKNILVITATFTLAHSMTLALSIVKDINIEPWIIESAIALSIVYIAFENLWFWRKRSGEQAVAFINSIDPHRVAVVFLFGLIHGFGFSYLLKEIGFENQMLGALLFFNLGVEAGQLIIVACIAPILYLLFKLKAGIAVSKLGSIAIALLGSVWLVERLS